MQIRKRVLQLAMPAVVSNLLYTFQNIVDAIMIGHYKEPEVSISAVGLGGMTYFLFFPLIMGLTTGGVAIIARRWGERNFEDARKTFEDLYTLLILISLPISLFAIFFGWTIPYILGADTIVVNEAYRYIMGVFVFYPFAVFMASYHSAIRAAGDTKIPMLVDLFANSWNILWNYILIFGKFGFPELGVLGAAIATGSSYLFGTVFYFYLQKKGKLIVYPNLLSRRKIDLKIVIKLFKIGIPAGIERGMWALTSFIYTGIIIAVGGSLGYAAFQVGLKAESLAYMPGFGFSIAATTLVGQYLGMGNAMQAKKAAFESVKLCAIFMGVAGLIMILFPSYLSLLFTEDMNIVKLSAIYLFLMGFTEPFLGVLFTLAGGMRGAGYTVMPMVINLTGLLGIRIGLALVLAYSLGLGLIGVWLGMMIETYIRAAWMYLEFRRGKWARVKV